MSDLTLTGHAGDLYAREWVPSGDATWIALLCHGYGEHVGRYEYVAERLTDDGAAVYGLDHVGHGRSDGERVLIADFEPVVADFHELADAALERHPGLPVVLVGHSMGGMIAARYTQLHGDELACTVLSGPVLGRWEAVESLLDAEEIPDTPIEPSTLSRDAAIGEAYVADELVWHGPFKRPTLQALHAAMGTIRDAGRIESTPVLWLHGEEDQLVPMGATRGGWDDLVDLRPESRAGATSYPGARHEIFNETNKDEVLDDALAFVHRHLPG